jgi:hypothetical protein
MLYRLRDDVHWCLCSGRVIFLDLLQDRYSCLPQAAAAAFVRLARGDMKAEDLERLRPLIARGLLVDDPSAKTSIAPARIVPPVEDFLEEPYPPATLRDLLAAAAAQLRWALLLRTQSLAKLASSLGASPRRRRLPDSDADRRLGRIISAFSAAALLLPAADRCLVRALALHSVCRRSGIDPHLVFGVRMNPFRAHCLDMRRRL